MHSSDTLDGCAAMLFANICDGRMPGRASGSYIMNRDRIEGGWKKICGKIGERWSDFLDDEAGADAARQTQLAGNQQLRRGNLQESTDRQLVEFRERNRRWDAPGRLSHGERMEKIS